MDVVVVFLRTYEAGAGLVAGARVGEERPEPPLLWMGRRHPEGWFTR